MEKNWKCIGSSLQLLCKFISTSLQLHSNFITSSLQVHHNINTTSLQLHYKFTPTSSQLHLQLHSNSILFKFSSSSSPSTGPIPYKKFSYKLPYPCTARGIQMVQIQLPSFTLRHDENLVFLLSYQTNNDSKNMHHQLIDFPSFYLSTILFLTYSPLGMSIVPSFVLQMIKYNIQFCY